VTIEAAHRSGGVQSVERTFALLEALSRRGSLGVSDLAAESGLSLATIHRLLRTLVDLGYVRQEPTRTYALGPGFIRLGEQASIGLAAWSRPLLEELVARLGESVNLAALEGDRIVYLAHVPSSHSIRMFTEVGSRVPVHSTGVGKAILAELGPERTRALIARTGMPAMTAHTLPGVLDLEVELESVRAEGYAVDEQEQELGVRCVAVAVPGDARLAVSMSGPVARVSDELIGRAVPLLQDVARRIAAETKGRA
jgi:IclR family transcriptional regulator, acetate operon repressor